MPFFYLLDDSKRDSIDKNEKNYYNKVSELYELPPDYLEAK